MYRQKLLVLSLYTRCLFSLLFWSNYHLKYGSSVTSTSIKVFCLKYFEVKNDFFSNIGYLASQSQWPTGLVQSHELVSSKSQLKTHLGLDAQISMVFFGLIGHDWISMVC